MKRIFICILAAALVLGGCAQGEAPTEPSVTETTVPRTEPTTEPTTEATTEAATEPQPMYENPLNGERIFEPYTGRIFANVISNVPAALPHVGVNQADILMEMFVNGSIIRCLALYTDISRMEAIGSTRSTRLMFNDIAQHYDAILSHAGYSNLVGMDAHRRGIDHINIDAYTDSHDYSFRDEERNRKLGWEHCLMAYGPGILKYAQEQGMRLTQPEEKDYLLRFADDGTPAGGEDAYQVRINLSYYNQHKETLMIYDPELGRYVFNQYAREMADGVTGERETFTNVLVMYAPITEDTGYQKADFLAGGEGYFACGGKIVPIRWECGGEDQPFRFLNADGTPLTLGRGSSYIAICMSDSRVTWAGAEG